MKVFFRSLEDGSHLALTDVFRLNVLSDKYEIIYRKEHAPLVEYYHFRFYSLFGVSHEDL